MEESTRTMQLIVQIALFGPLIASIIGIVVAVAVTNQSQPLSRLSYFVRVVALFVAGYLLSFAISRALGPSEEALQQFLADEIISSLWIVTIASMITALIAGFIFGRFTVERSHDMGKSNAFALLAIFTPALIYFFFAPSRKTS